jgi:hypothetical protein
MEAPVNGARLGSAFFSVTVTHAKCVVGKAIRLITYCHAWQVGQMMNGIYKPCVEVAILRRGVGFLVNLRHP